ncbi:MAG: hypothetical protein DI539_00055 [Flavobacterium psychrophilum]|nr:MAG: hypothetical protein DI539_00055 [Flavobacterium psychrophilum]
MKKLLFLLLLCPLMVMAEDFYPATITYMDGTTRTGFANIPAMQIYKLKFKETAKGKVEKIDNSLLKSMELIDKKGKKMSFVALRWSNWSNWSKKFIFDEKKSWAQIIKQGKVSYVIYYSYESVNTRGGYDNHIWIEGDDFSYGYFVTLGGFTISVGYFDAFETKSKFIFEKDCPEMIKKITKKEFEKKGIEYLTELYDENCGSTK